MTRRTAAELTLDDKYTLEEGRVYLTGVQALVRLPLEQMARDRRRGLETGCFISGYEGSPLGGYDLQLQSVGALLAERGVRFQPGVNEDLAATSVSGSQMGETLPGGQTVDGVVGIWYGKGPGVDRSGDAFRHANLAGTGRNGGAVALCGDDHVSKSSTVPHQSELALYSAGIPILTPGSVQEALDLGLYAIEMSRFSGVWTALKLATDVCDGGATIDVSPERCPIEIPEFLVEGKPFEKRIHPKLVIPDSLEAERDLFERRLEAARRFARANRLDRIVVRGERDRVGLVAVGKAYHDLRTALRNLGFDDDGLRRAGIRLLKPALVFPLEPEIFAEFAEGLETIVVLEEKRSFVEMQLRELLYDAPDRPRIYGKRGPDGEDLLPAWGELDAERISQALARWLPEAEPVAARLAEIDRLEALLAESETAGVRAPVYCSGCPHNRSTLLFGDQVAGGGIGCHAIAALSEPDRGVLFLGHMGSEGGHWIGMAPFSERKHLFQNIGDGTYFHSGRQAVLASVASGVNVTYKILHNGAVAMTGGQHPAGAIGIPEMTRELEAIGVRKIALLTDDLSRYEDRNALSGNTAVRPREELEEAMRELEAIPGVTVLIYDQMCATEKRRARSRGKLPQPTRRLIINERVCEGCGDCVRKSNCVSLHPVETEYGPKTRIHQSSCNVDLTCALGDCPSFVAVDLEPGTALKKAAARELPEVEVPEPEITAPGEAPFHILMPGVGGTGVVTVNAVLATAALLDGLSVVTLDQTGLAQKGGAVVSHLAVRGKPFEASQRISYGKTDLLLGFDVVGAAGARNLVRLSPDRTVGVVNTHETPTGEAVRQGLTVLSPDHGFERAIRRFTREEDNVFLDASRLAEALFGSHLQTNLLLVGVAWQRGLLPISRESIEQAIRLNGVAVEKNLAALHWGRVYAHDRELVLKTAYPERAEAAKSLDELVADRGRELVAYQDERYAARYRRLVERVREAERRVAPDSEALATAVAHNLFKLMAYKDEYEVARLLTDPAFEAQIGETFQTPRRYQFQLHPPLLRAWGLKKKLSFGPWARPLLRGLARLKGLRGTAFDPFGGARVRREERALIDWYEQVVERLLDGLSPVTLAEAAALAEAPDGIRGYEEIKLRSAEAVRAETAERLKAFAAARAA